MMSCRNIYHLHWINQTGAFNFIIAGEFFNGAVIVCCDLSKRISFTHNHTQFIW